MVYPVKQEELNLTVNTEHEQQQQHYRLQLLAQAIEKVESECSQKKRRSTAASPTSKKQSPPIESLAMAATLPLSQQQEFLMRLLTQQNVAAVMAAAAAAGQLQQQKPEPISPPSTSSASSSVESPLDFSSRRSTDDINECSSPASPQRLSAMLQNLQSTSSLSKTNFPFLLTNKNGKPTRPFKAYPRDPLMLPLGFCSGTSSEQTNILVDAANRKRLAQTQERLKQQQLLNSTHFISSSGTQILQPPKKRHRVMDNSILQDEINANNEPNNGIKDDAYWERRRKNNEAAKRSRDARRVKEDEIAIRAALLEQENMKLRMDLTQLKQETAKLRCMMHGNS